MIQSGEINCDRKAFYAKAKERFDKLFITFDAIPVFMEQNDVIYEVML
jgi:hypothetical protein